MKTKKIETKQGENKSLTELIFILDRSGSMGGLEKETINGYNSVINNQAKLGGDVKVTTILFDNQYEVIFDGECPKKAKLDDKKYYVRGTTALLDAIGLTIKTIEARHKQNSCSPDKVIVAITTDGYENASREYSYSQIKTLIEERQKMGWEFMFLAANIDEKKVGGDLGIKTENCTKFVASKQGMAKMCMDMDMMMTKARKK